MIETAIISSMKISILYRPNSEHGRKVEDYITDFERFHPGQALETYNVDTMEGARLAETYGVMEYPAVIATKNDGQVQQMWVGSDKLPLMNDLVYYAQQ